MTNEKTEGRWIDRTGWAPGPWNDEDDRYEWRSQGLPCLIVRGPAGALCGYVGVPPGHPWNGKEDEGPVVSVHGGITYGNKCQVGGHICHVAKPGEPEDVWWLGFDCNHCGDLAPGTEATLRSLGHGGYYNHGEMYRDVDYVRLEVESLAAQVRCAAIIEDCK